MGRANYADNIGEYYTAFFGLSVGVERLAKLILVTDYTVSNGGQMPEQPVLRKFGHKLVELIDAADAVAQKNKLKLVYPRPTDAIGAKILECLDAFADASRGRYANFATLGDPTLGQEEPIHKWWDEVAELILKEHYYDSQLQKRRLEFGRLQCNGFAVALRTSDIATMRCDIVTPDCPPERSGVSISALSTQKRIGMSRRHG